jgi:4,5-DOPA dioxygenase extradiol
MVVFEDIAYDWALAFDGMVKKWILEGNHDLLIQYHKQGREAALSINSAEHYKPLLYVLGAQDSGEPVSFFTEKVWGGSVSMRSIRIG